MQLMVQNGPESGKTFALDRPLLVIGRQAGSDIRLNDSRVSRRHLQIENRNGELFVTDLGSANGSFLNGQQLAAGQPQTLRLTNNLLVGQTLMLALPESQAHPFRPSAPEVPTLARQFEPPNLPVSGYLPPLAAPPLAAPGFNPPPPAFQPFQPPAPAGFGPGPGPRPGPVPNLVPAPQAPPKWQTFPGQRVTLYAQEGSYPASVAPAELREAAKAAAELEKLLEMPRRAAPVPVFLLGPEDMALARSGPRPPEAIERIVQPQTLVEPITWPLTRALVARWSGIAISAQTALVFNGLAGLVAARTGSGPTVEEAHKWVREELKADHPVSIFADPARNGTPAVENPAVNLSNTNLVATSFIAYLVESAGLNAFRQFLKSYDAARRDQAAVAAFQRPLGAIEEEWQKWLRRSEARNSVFRDFMGQLGPLLKPYWLREIEVLFYMLLGLSYTLIMPLATRFLVDDIIPGRKLGDLGVFIGFLLVCYFLNAIIAVRRSYVNNWVNERVLITLQERMFSRLLKLSHSFYTEAKIGDLMSRFSRDLSAVQRAMSQVVGVGIYMGLNVVVAAIAIVVLNPFLGLLILVVVPLFALSYIFLRGRLEKASRQEAELAGEAANTVQENLLGHTLIKAFSMEDRINSVFKNRLEALFKAGLKLVIMGSLFEISVTLAIAMGQLIVLGVGGYLVIQSNLTIGTLLAFIGLLPTLFGPIASLSSVGQSIQMASGSLSRIRELLAEPVTIADKPNALVLPPLSREIVFDRVNFSYDEERQVLKNISLKIPAGRHTAVVGPSGSGKSTLVNLILRFWDTTNGGVYFDGHNIQDVTLASLRGQTGVVFQDTFVFDTTLRENIALGRPNATDKEIEASCRAANLDSFVNSLPAGFDTTLGEQGVKMSGGQRQRLAIARALLRNPQLLILDEATSALDAQTESEILETLKTLLPGRTTLSITHRLNLASTADWIIVLQDGQIAEQGTHPQLLGKKGLYHQLYTTQHLED
jgi:ABC-type multidrug transport system fused ATPase/permease subunit